MAITDILVLRSQAIQESAFICLFSNCPFATYYESALRKKAHPIPFDEKTENELLMQSSAIGMATEFRPSV